MSATIVILLCALACPVGMGLMMILMREHGGSRKEHPEGGEKHGRPE